MSLEEAKLLELSRNCVDAVARFFDCYDASGTLREKAASHISKYIAQALREERDAAPQEAANSLSGKDWKSSTAIYEAIRALKSEAKP